MTVITVGHIKGGVGKSPTLQNLAIMRALAGYTVAVVDTDPQGTSARFFAAREGEGREPAVAWAELLGGDLAGMVAKFDDDGRDVFIDAGGREDEALAEAIGISDALVIPASVKSFALDAAPKLDHLVGAIGRSDLVVLPFLTDCNPLPNLRSKELIEARQVMAECSNLPLIGELEVISSPAWSEAFAENLSVVEYQRNKLTTMRPYARKNFSPNASHDLAMLYAAVFGELFDVQRYVLAMEQAQ